MAHVIQVSSREFRAKQKDYLDLADEGAQIIVRRRRRPSYMLTPIDDSDLLLADSVQEKIKRGLQEIKEGKGQEYSLEEIKEILGL